MEIHKEEMKTRKEDTTSNTQGETGRPHKTPEEKTHIKIHLPRWTKTRPTWDILPPAPPTFQRRPTEDLESKLRRPLEPRKEAVEGPSLARGSCKTRLFEG